MRYDSCWADSVGGGGGAAADSCLEGVAAAAADGTAGGLATLFTSQLVYRSGGDHGTGGADKRLSLCKVIKEFHALRCCTDCTCFMMYLRNILIFLKLIETDIHVISWLGKLVSCMIIFYDCHFSCE